MDDSNEGADSDAITVSPSTPSVTEPEPGGNSSDSSNPQTSSGNAGGSPPTPPATGQCNDHPDDDGDNGNPPKINKHHSDPIFIGGASGQELTIMTVDAHRALHKAMWEFLDTKTNNAGDSMRPKRGNCGRTIRENFTRQQLLDAMAEFYRGPGARFTNAAKDFFAQHPSL